MAPLDFGSYSAIGFPWLGASDSRTLRGITVGETRSPKYSRTSVTT